VPKVFIKLVILFGILLGSLITTLLMVTTEGKLQSQTLPDSHSLFGCSILSVEMEAASRKSVNIL
jgi:hypothetical protein